MVIDKNPTHWKLLVFYYNPEEPRVFVTKRTGLGWTVNFARPAAQVITGLLIVACIATVVINNAQTAH